MQALPVSWLDVKLGIRMLAKHPGLTLVGGLAMTVAIALGAVFHITAAVVDATLPLDEGDRIVVIENWDAAINNQEPRILHDFVAWREQLRSVLELGAWRTVTRNLIVPGVATELVPVAEMTASGFRLARVAPLLGRPLVETDERTGAPPVLVIGADEWRTQFASDAAVIGREVRLGDIVHVIVGVMPDGFAFPVNHRFWIPLLANPFDYERRNGPEISVFGRLAPGATLADAQVELTAIGARAAAAFPDTHRQLRPRIIPYTAQLFDDMEGWEIAFVRTLLFLLLVVICVNVAVLVYARTATRQGEIVVRSALGAGRPRLIGQLFAEALVLSGGAAVVALVVAALSLRRLDAFLASLTASGGGLPFWVDLHVSAGTILYVAALAVVAAAILGVVPAVSATGRRLQPLLGQTAAGSGMRLGRTWTLLIAAQVAFAVAILPAGLFYAATFLRFGLAQPGFAGEFLTAALVMDGQPPPSAQAEAYNRAFESRYVAGLEETLRRVGAEPEVSGVTFAEALPGQDVTVTIEIEAAPGAASASSHPVRINRVALNFFDVFGVDRLAGRSLQPGDLASESTAVVVNRSFVREVLGDADALGRRFRYVEGYRAGGVMQPPPGGVAGRWYEIVGVVGDLPANPVEPADTGVRLYHALAPTQIQGVRLAVRTRRAPAAEFSTRLREITTQVDPGLQLRAVLPLEAVVGALQAGFRLGAIALGLVTISVLLLSAAGIYAMMSFAVTQRTREIGIRAALGADPRRIVGSIFSKAAFQLCIGIAAGLTGAALLDTMTGGQLFQDRGYVLVPAVALLMVCVAAMAAIGPARRGLRIDATEAMRAE